MEELVLGKYRLLEQIGRGGNSVVFLAEHCILHQKRVIKIIEKSHPHCRTFLNEVKFLKNLRYAGIPVLYDYEEDDRYSYIVEEYVAGKSYRDEISHARIPTQQILKDFMSICSILKYLHMQKPYPVLYLDLKPEHIVSAKRRIYLLDFGAAVEKKDMAVNGCCMGTEGFASPEVMHGECIDERADVYSLGAVLLWCLTGHTVLTAQNRGEICEILTEYPKGVQSFVCKCIEEQPCRRFQSIQEAETALYGLLNVPEDKDSSYRIAVVGSQSRIGVTHFCVALAKYLNMNHRKCLYEEKTDAAFLVKLPENHKEFYEKDGLVLGKDFFGLPKYGRAVAAEDIYFPFVVEDYGAFDSQQTAIKQADLCIALMGSNAWELSFSRRLYHSVRNLAGPALVFVLQQGMSEGKKNNRLRVLPETERVFCFPVDIDPFHMGQERRKFFSLLTAYIFRDELKGGNIFEKGRMGKKHSADSRGHRK